MEFRAGYDGGYELRLRAAAENENDKTIARFDELARLNPFEERPLIWKAVALQCARKLDEAERVCAQAIAMDPLDGRENTCDTGADARPDGRMRGYAVLADVLEAGGDADRAAPFRRRARVVDDIAQAERLYDAGLLKRAVEVYLRTAALRRTSNPCNCASPHCWPRWGGSKSRTRTTARRTR